MSTPFVPATSIDEVIQRLDAIIDHAAETHNAIGIFPALYVVVTEKIKAAIDAGDVFEDNPRMEKLDIIFANRYLEAYHLYNLGEPVTQSWQVAFDAAKAGGIKMILQDLLIGTNAHVNLDLGIAAAATAPGEAIDDLYNDFMVVNRILNQITSLIQAELGGLSPRIALVERWMKGKDEAILNFSVNRARDAAWLLAKQLARLEGEAWKEKVKERDAFTQKLGKLILNPGLIGRIIAWWIRMKEVRHMPTVLAELRTASQAAAAKMAPN